MNAYKKYIIFAFVIPLSFIALFAVNLYLYDPAQIFHKPYFRKTTFFPDMRVSAKGIIQHYPFDSYIIGNSMLHNTSSKEAKEKLGGEWVNITMSSSAFDERGKILKYLFTHKNPIQILYSLGTNDDSSIERMSKFLYNETPLDDWRVYVNERFILCSLVWSDKEKCVGSGELESLMFWKEPDLQSLFGIENWIKQHNIKGHIKAIYEYENKLHSQQTIESLGLEIQRIQKDMDENILSFVEQNQNTQFYFIVPPYSRLSYKIGFKNKNFMKFKSILKWFVLELESYPNVRIYGFDTLDYADNIANYSDLVHYNIDMNSMQLDAIRDDTHRLTSENIEEYLKTMELKIQEYDVEPLVKIVKEALGE